MGKAVSRWVAAACMGALIPTALLVSSSAGHAAAPAADRAPRDPVGLIIFDPDRIDALKGGLGGVVFLALEAATASGPPRAAIRTGPLPLELLRAAGFDVVIAVAEWDGGAGASTRRPRRLSIEIQDARQQAFFKSTAEVMPAGTLGWKHARLAEITRDVQVEQLVVLMGSFDVALAGNLPQTQGYRKSFRGALATIPARSAYHAELVSGLIQKKYDLSEPHEPPVEGGGGFDHR